MKRMKLKVEMEAKIEAENLLKKAEEMIKSELI